MKRIIVKDIIKSDFATSPEDGDKLYKLIYEQIHNNKKIEIDFEGIDLVITAFLNNAIGSLYKHYNTNTLNDLLSIRNISQFDLELLKDVIEVAKTTFTNETIENIEGLLDE